uniref:Uncharacterized protein n=1 Tax=Callorhinchus milii TaxID=7868 RepID=A0A4W3JCL8_CALMI
VIIIILTFDTVSFAAANVPKPFIGHTANRRRSPCASSVAHTHSAPRPPEGRITPPTAAPQRPPAQGRRITPPTAAPQRPPAQGRRITPPTAAPQRPPAQGRRITPPHTTPLNGPRDGVPEGGGRGAEGPPADGGAGEVGDP